MGLGRDGPKVSGLIRSAVQSLPPLAAKPASDAAPTGAGNKAPEKSTPKPAPVSPLLPKEESKGHLLSGWLKRDTPKRSKIFTTPKGDVIKKANQPHEPEKRLVRCFDCNHRQWVPISAESTQCGRCSVYISMGDLVIKNPSSQNIRTRGDVTVEKRGSLIGCDIACHNLTVMGQISGSVDCSGVAHFKHSSKVMGSMHCKHLIIEKRCEIFFPQGVMAEEVDVYGTLIGNVLCSGVIRIYPTASVIGDATAKSIVMKDGGVLTGMMSIRQNLDITLPTKKRSTGFLTDTDAAEDDEDQL